MRSMRSTASRAPPASASCERAGLAGQREHGAVVVGVRVDVEQAGAAGGEGVADGVEHRGVAALGDVGDGEEHAQSTKRPASSTVVPPTVSVASSTTTSRWIGTATVPPMPGAGAEGDVDGAEDLLVLEHVAGQRGAVVGADAELGEVGARSPAPVEQLVRGARPRAGRLRQAPALDGQVRRVALDEADRGQRARRDRRPRPRPAR